MINLLYVGVFEPINSVYFPKILPVVGAAGYKPLLKHLQNYFSHIVCTVFSDP